MTDSSIPDLFTYSAMQLNGKLMKVPDQTIQGGIPPKHATKQAGQPVYFSTFASSGIPYLTKRYMFLKFPITGFNTYTVVSDYIRRDHLLAEGDDPLAPPAAYGMSRLHLRQIVQLRRPLTTSAGRTFPVGAWCSIVNFKSVYAPQITSDDEREQQLQLPIEMQSNRVLVYQVSFQFQVYSTLWYQTDAFEVPPAISSTAASGTT